ncbi:hypothetical protein HELRODRAFT_174505 [Helobdella robusta]|uniref:Endonuclease/exonuclease/phosphatase domain-containing protein n=1 Tax=Helobdella robusta TaxID=6412 RepID=T1F871_HELRO|nr:hypothetical protein HELRODRAFT_174505 [Helobdella robusta]ESO01543.1 hypothetical protein HELRODRAFT_174505 [Helobdella robusta]
MEIVDMLERRRVDICSLQETRWKSNGVSLIGSYKLFWNGQKTVQNGVGIFIRESLTQNVLEVVLIRSRLMLIKLRIGKQMPSGKHHHQIPLICGDLNGHVGDKANGFHGVHEAHVNTRKSTRHIAFDSHKYLYLITVAATAVHAPKPLHRLTIQIQWDLRTTNLMLLSIVVLQKKSLLISEDFSIHINKKESQLASSHMELVTSFGLVQLVYSQTRVSGNILNLVMVNGNMTVSNVKAQPPVVSDRSLVISEFLMIMQRRSKFESNISRYQKVPVSNRIVCVCSDTNVSSEYICNGYNNVIKFFADKIKVREETSESGPDHVISQCNKFLKFDVCTESEVCFGGLVSDEMEMQTGVSQGSVQGPILFFMYVFGLPGFVPAFASPSMANSSNAIMNNHAPITNSWSQNCVTLK